MNFIFSNHAEQQLVRRSLDRNIVESVVCHPDQICNDENDIDVKVFQSVVKEDNTLFLYRIFVNINSQPNVIVTLYKTTKIEKYYES
jgi:hypothetical protein